MPIGPANWSVSVLLLKDLIKLYESSPEIFEKNKDYEEDEGLKKSIRNDSE